ncbi:hypothetical protein BTG_19640 [Sporocytophaga myxococcoides]|uniref:Uncharacterized protein n=1 Tax=Sporocytophaga myxococcoides TaxID=153721 RepID=A0A098LKJ0_9BACT|nr:three component ABC system middle component [Sporocytophaga myxococcoides]GAL86837.1 hypothetical protein BTG_19640 [Sporocytophaga myxococcoides]
MKIKSVYHNELLGLIAVDAVLQRTKLISHAKSLLILPLLFHNETLNYILENKITNIEEIVTKRCKLISNFEIRYYSFLPITINAIYLGSSLGYLNVNEDGLGYIQNNGTSREDLGMRANKLINAAPLVGEILNEDAIRLYSFLHLKI